MHTFIKALSILTILLLTNCTKSAGVGGKATIKGKVTVTNIKNGIVKDKYDAQAHNIYIIYGDGNLYQDDFKTSLDGTFIFNDLNKGKYQLFTYSDCENCPKGQDSLIIIPLEINEKKQVLELEIIEIINYI